jgi:23S rRNA (guanine745-N1)-methyltransferase
MLWRCPHDGAMFETTRSGVRCPLGHSFDRAREGYLNLTVAGRRPGSRPAGDSLEMLRARRTFLEAGHYAPVAAAVARHVAAVVSSPVLCGQVVDMQPPDGSEAVDVLDAGCGEGWYLGQLVARVAGVRGWGLDVAKDGVRLAARRYPSCGFAVASSYRLPVAEASVAAVVSVFSPRPFAEFFRVLRPGGAVVVASPGPEHLAGLKALVYDDPRQHDERPHTDPADDGHAPPTERERVRAELVLAGGDALALLQMTPYWWHATPEQQSAVAALDRLETVVDVVVTTHPRP